MGTASELNFEKDKQEYIQIVKNEMPINDNKQENDNIRL